MSDAVEEQRRLGQKHRRCEERLRALRGRLLLSDDEKREEIDLKKKKLFFKDRIETLARSLRAATSDSTG